MKIYLNIGIALIFMLHESCSEKSKTENSLCNLSDINSIDSIQVESLRQYHEFVFMKNSKNDSVRSVFETLKKDIDGLECYYLDVKNYRKSKYTLPTTDLMITSFNELADKVMVLLPIESKRIIKFKEQIKLKISTSELANLLEHQTLNLIECILIDRLDELNGALHQ